MLLPQPDAQRFIAGYKAVLLEVLSASGKKRSNDIVGDLAAARSYAKQNAVVLANAIDAIQARGEQLDEDVAKAVRSLRVGQWFHIHHTTKYALLLDAATENAYAVKALTNPLHEIAGSRCVTFEAGVLDYRSQYVCDAIISQPIHLGPGVRVDLKEAYARIKAAGRFHVRAEV